MSEDDEIAIWQMCCDLIQCAPPDVKVDIKIRAVTLHLACITSILCSNDYKGTCHVIDAVAKSAKEAASVYGPTFRELQAHVFSEPDSTQ